MSLCNIVTEYGLSIHFLRHKKIVFMKHVRNL